MYQSRPPRRSPAIDDCCLLETALVAIGVSCLFVAATLPALAAAAAVDDPPAAAAVALFVGIASLFTGIVGTRLLRGWLVARLE